MSLSGVININLRRALSKKDKHKLKQVFKEYSPNEIQGININTRKLYLTVETRHSYNLFKMLMDNDIFPSTENKKHLIVENLINDRCGKQALYILKNRPDLAILEFNEHWTSNALFGASVKFDFHKEKNKELLSYILKQIPLEVIDKKGDNVITYLLSNIQEKMSNYSHYSFKKRPLQDIDMMLNNVYFFAVNKGVSLKHEVNGESIIEMFDKIETKNLSGQKEHQDLRIKLEKIRNTIFSDAEKVKILKAINEKKEENKPANKKRL